jgi:tmRNA-binding protein
MSKRDYNKLLSTLQNLKIELYLSYKDMGFNAALINSLIRWYELASYTTIEENNDNHSKVYLHLNDFVTIQEEVYKESYAIVKGIF